MWSERFFPRKEGSSSWSNTCWISGLAYIDLSENLTQNFNWAVPGLVLVLVATLVFLLCRLLLKKHCQEGMTSDLTQLILKDIAPQLLVLCSFAASSGFSQYFSIQDIDPRSSLVLKHVACVGFLFNETLHVPLEFDKDCSRCLVWML